MTFKEADDAERQEVECGTERRPNLNPSDPKTRDRAGRDQVVQPGREKGKRWGGSPLGCPARQPKSPAAPRRSRSQTWRRPPNNQPAPEPRRRSASHGRAANSLVQPVPVATAASTGSAPPRAPGSSHSRGAPEPGLPAALPEAQRALSRVEQQH